MPLVQELWKDKVYVPKEIREAHPKVAYVKSLGDSQRNSITQDELCSFSWSFRCAPGHVQMHQQDSPPGTLHSAMPCSDNHSAATLVST